MREYRPAFSLLLSGFDAAGGRVLNRDVSAVGRERTGTVSVKCVTVLIPGDLLDTEGVVAQPAGQRLLALLAGVRVRVAHGRVQPGRVRVGGRELGERDLGRFGRYELRARVTDERRGETVSPRCRRMMPAWWASYTATYAAPTP